MEALRLRQWEFFLRGACFPRYVLPGFSCLGDSGQRITVWLVLLAIVASAPNLHAATYQTRNFSVTADRPEVAEQIGQAAEDFRRQLAIFWLGDPLPNWSKPCRLRVREGRMGAGGQTTFQFSRGEVINWDMSVQGTLERILDSVLPHEINHTIFACHFRRPLPRWADEGAATLFEHRSEQLKQLALLNEVISNEQERYSLQQLLSMKEYPTGMRQMLILYAQGFALADFLVQQKGRQAYLQLLNDGERLGWEQAIRKNFDHDGIDSLERNWKGWVLAGMPKLTIPRDQMLASLPARQTTSRISAQILQVELPHEPAREPHPVEPPKSAFERPVARDTLVRGQSPDPDTGASESSSVERYPQQSESTGPRRGTIQAPSPISSRSDRPVENASPSMNRISAGGQTESWPSTTSAQPASDRYVMDAGNPNELEISNRRRRLELTGAATKPDDAARRGLITEFESVHLPKERNVVSGSSPEWAGFPGQKKLF